MALIVVHEPFEDGNPGDEVRSLEVAPDNNVGVDVYSGRATGGLYFTNDNYHSTSSSLTTIHTVETSGTIQPPGGMLRHYIHNMPAGISAWVYMTTPPTNRICSGGFDFLGYFYGPGGVGDYDGNAFRLMCDIIATGNGDGHYGAPHTRLRIQDNGDDVVDVDVFPPLDTWVQYRLEFTGTDLEIEVVGVNTITWPFTPTGPIQETNNSTVLSAYTRDAGHFYLDDLDIWQADVPATATASLVRSTADFMARH